MARKGQIFPKIFWVIAIFFIWVSFPVAAADLIEGRVVNLHPESRTVTVLDFYDSAKKEVVFDSIKGIKKNSVIKIWVSSDGKGTLKAKKIAPLRRYDSTGMKRRLRKALLRRHGAKGRGHRGRCRAR